MVKHTSSSRSAAASAPLRLGPPSHSTCRAPRAPSSDHRDGKVHVAGAGLDDVGPLARRGEAVRRSVGGGDHDGPLHGLGEQGRVPVEVEAAGDDRDPRPVRLPARAAGLGVLVLHFRRLVVLGPHGSGGHEHDVGERAEQPVDELVGRAAQGARHARRPGWRRRRSRRSSAGDRAGRRPRAGRRRRTPRRRGRRDGGRSGASSLRRRRAALGARGRSRVRRRAGRGRRRGR